MSSENQVTLVEATKRHGQITFSDQSDCSWGKSFASRVQKILPNALEECDPLVRKANIEVTLVDQIGDPVLVERGVRVVLAQANSTVNSGVVTTSIKISANASKPPNYIYHPGDEILATHSLLHEVFEIDGRLLDKRRGEEENYTHDDPNYTNKRTEVRSDKRALRQLNIGITKRGKLYRLKRGERIRFVDEVSL